MVRGERERHARGEQRGEGGRPAAVQVVQARVESEREVGRARAPRQRVGLSERSKYCGAAFGGWSVTGPACITNSFTYFAGLVEGRAHVAQLAEGLAEAEGTPRAVQPLRHFGPNEEDVGALHARQCTQQFEPLGRAAQLRAGLGLGLRLGSGLGLGLGLG